MMWQSVKDTERFDFVPKTKVIYVPLGQGSFHGHIKFLFKLQTNIDMWPYRVNDLYEVKRLKT